MCRGMAINLQCGRADGQQRPAAVGRLLGWFGWPKVPSPSWPEVWAMLGRGAPPSNPHLPHLPGQYPHPQPPPPLQHCGRARLGCRAVCSRGRRCERPGAAWQLLLGHRQAGRRPGVSRRQRHGTHHQRPTQQQKGAGHGHGRAAAIHVCERRSQLWRARAGSRGGCRGAATRQPQAQAGGWVLLPVLSMCGCWVHDRQIGRPEQVAGGGGREQQLCAPAASILARVFLLLNAAMCCP